MFIYQKSADVLDYVPLKAGVEVQVGSCLVMGEGGLVLCGAAVTPEYISNVEAQGDGSVIAVSKITSDATLIGTLAADSAAIAVGVKLQLAADGICVGAAEGGALEVIAFDGNKAGDKVIVAVK